MTALPLLDTASTQSASNLGLTFDFPMMTSGLSFRAPWAVPLEEVLGELEREARTRRGFYPGQVTARKLTQVDADGRMAALQAAHDALTPAQADYSPPAVTWRTMVAELRREILMRRAVYPKRIDDARMTRDEARVRLEGVEGAHWRLWILAEGWTLTDADCAAGPKYNGGRMMADLRAHIDASFAWEAEARRTNHPAARPLKLFDLPVGYAEGALAQTAGTP